MAHWLLFLCASLPFIHPVKPRLRSPHPVVYQYDIGDPIHLNHFFQYSDAQMAFTKIFLHPTAKPPKFSAKTQDNPIDLASILYRTHSRKGVLFHFQSGSLDQLTDLLELLTSIDRPNNVLKLPLLSGPGNSESIVNPNEFLQSAPSNVKIALGFAEEYPLALDNEDGYTQHQIDTLAETTEPFCRDTNSRYFIALNAYFVASAEKNFQFDFYSKFQNCRLLLYTLPKQPAVNVQRLKDLLLRQIHLDRMLVLVSGHSLAYRLFSLECIVWGYAEGHAVPAHEQLGEFGLASVIESGARTIRLSAYAMTSRQYLPWVYTFRYVTENEMLRTNFDPDIMQYLAQLLDKSRILLLRPNEWQPMGNLVEVFRHPNLPFYEARILRGPNVKHFDAEMGKAFWTWIDDYKQKRLEKYIFSFQESHGEYTPAMIENFLSQLKQHYSSFNGYRFGLLLEIGFVSDQLDFTELLQNQFFQFVFLKSDHTPIGGEQLQRMQSWIEQFQEKVVFLVMNDQVDKLNRIYKYFAHVDPDGGWMTTTTTTPDGWNVSTETPGTQPERTTMNPILIEETTTVKEPPLLNNTAKAIKSMGSNSDGSFYWLLIMLFGGLFII